MTKKIYVASSWRNDFQPMVVDILRTEGFGVYDFRNNDAMFHWRDLDSRWKFWTFSQCEHALNSPVAQKAYEADLEALLSADAGLLVMPCGRSAHLELGVLIGRRVPTIILHPSTQPVDPELMTLMTDFRTDDFNDAIEYLKVVLNES